MPHGDGKRGHEEPPSPQRSGGSGGLSRRSGVWLTTLSTVVAVATGMFTLRDQIFPANAGNAQASRGAYEQFVGHVCNAVNAAERARARNAGRLSQRLKASRTTLAQRNALLDSAKEILASSEHRLAGFKGLDAPGGLTARHSQTAAAWGRMVAEWRGYAQRLDTVTHRRDLLAAVRMLSAMRTALSREGVTRDAGLTRLGGGHCELDAPIVTPTITLREPAQLVTSSSEAQPSVDPPRPSADPPRPSADPPKQSVPPPADPPPAGSAPPAPVPPPVDPSRGAGESDGEGGG
jgi:hypothetical protein